MRACTRERTFFFCSRRNTSIGFCDLAIVAVVARVALVRRVARVACVCRPYKRTVRIVLENITIGNSISIEMVLVTKSRGCLDSVEFIEVFASSIDRTSSTAQHPFKRVQSPMCDGSMVTRSGIEASGARVVGSGIGARVRML